MTISQIPLRNKAKSRFPSINAILDAAPIFLQNPVSQAKTWILKNLLGTLCLGGISYVKGGLCSSKQSNKRTSNSSYVYPADYAMFGL